MTRETAKQIAERIAKGRPPKRPMFVSYRDPVEGITISSIGGGR
jgi:hypothetical protein